MSLNDLSNSEPAPRPVRRSVGTFVVMGVAGLLAWAVVKHVSTGGLADSEVHAGVEDLSRAIRTGAVADFAEAEDHFVDAASVSVVDRYPAFLIHAGREVQSPSGEGARAAIARAVASGDEAGARAACRELEKAEPAAGRYWSRLLDELTEAGAFSRE